MVNLSNNDDEDVTKNIMMGFDSERVDLSAGVFIVQIFVEPPQNHSGGQQ